MVAGSFRLTFPALICWTNFCGRASTSTFKPTARAVLGLTPGPTPPLCAALNGFVELQGVAPERFVAESVEAKDLPALRQHLLTVRIDHFVEVSVTCSSIRLCTVADETGAGWAEVRMTTNRAIAMIASDSEPFVTHRYLPSRSE